MHDPQTNLQVLRPSRKKPRAGDIFVMRLPDGTHVFGRVVAADLTEPHEAPMPGSYLICVYKHRSLSKTPDVGALTRDELLLPLVFINKMPWTRGYFETVANTELTPGDVIIGGSFWDAARARFVDRDGNVLSRERQPSGDWALMSYRWLDDQISDALGIPRVAEDA